MAKFRFLVFLEIFCVVFSIGKDFFNFAGGSNMLDGGMNELLQFLENF